MRHAKSDWNADYNRDFDRPLNRRGKKAAPRMGEFLLEKLGSPQLIISSPAKRAISTARLLAENCDYVAEIVTRQELYDSSVDEYMLVIQSIPERLGNCVIVGHNFTVEETISHLLEDSAFVRMPTAAQACIGFDVDEWSKVGARSGKLLWHQKPKEL